MNIKHTRLYRGIDTLKGKLTERLAESKVRLLELDRRRPNLKLIALGVAVAVFTFALGERNLWQYYLLQDRASYLHEQIDYYRPRLEADSLRIEQIQRKGAEVEFVAREQYLMKSPGEHIYILSEAPTAD